MNLNGSKTEIRIAADRIRPYVRKTPVLTSRTLDEQFGAKFFFKCENFQRVGAFKFRGACNAVFSLASEQAARGVATHSSGNHAQAVALAARLRGIAAHIVVPRDAPAVKLSAVEGYGARVYLCEPGMKSREEALARVVCETGAEFIPPYNDARVIFGQATAALELFDDVCDLDLLLGPVGGGGLMSGAALAATAFSPKTQVIGAEPELAADAYLSLRDQKIYPPLETSAKTVADGLRGSLGDLTYAILRDHARKIVTVDELSILEAMRWVWERMKIVIEPSSAVALAAIFEKKVEVAGSRVGILVSGGNVDFRA